MSRNMFPLPRGLADRVRRAQLQLTGQGFTALVYRAMGIGLDSIERDLAVDSKKALLR